MTRTRTEVVAAVHAAFRKRAWSRVLMLLDTYGVNSYEREVARVQLAIVKLSEGSEEKLREYIAVAKRDYRDALFWAEHPDEAKVGHAGEEATTARVVRETWYGASDQFVRMIV